MRYLSVCSGIEAASVAWKPLGWEAVAFAEIEKFPSAVLAHHYPDVPNWGDMTKFKDWPDEPVDLLVGGTPCQAFSVAGLRKGLADPRGNLTLTYLAVAAKYRPQWVVWENVPGVLSDGTGAFGAFLGGLGELGYGFAYRVLDAQYAGVPQRRRRVFVVGCSGDWRRAAAVLFERHSLQGNPAPRRKAWERPAPTIAARTRGGGGLGTDFDCDGGLIASTGDVSHCLNGGGMGRQDYETETLVVDTLTSNGDAHSGYRDEKGLVPVAHAFDARQSDVIQYGDKTGPLDTDGHTMAVAFTASEQSNSFAWEKDVYPALDAQVPNDSSNIQKGIRQGMQVRRLTPRECDRLQGFPDDYELVPYNGKPAKDGPRYKALGNSMAVPVMRWIGERIAKVAALP